MKKATSFIGQLFTRLLVIDGPVRVPNGQKMFQTGWKCICVCGKETIVSAYKLKSGRTKSCGCFLIDSVKETRKRLPRAALRHGHSAGGKTSKTYQSWFAMIQRCTNKNNKRYEHYGGRGISVCERWLKFDNFLKDMGDRPDEMTIDRINVNGDYEPSNCRWADSKTQSLNKQKHSIKQL